ncbi:putative HET domain-containing protein [Triangularia verruculosa]|uniref:HET domain-containing protein n=1 Tax=Triangularia verruculosa TaxID=2587418 RepID=A0AAN6X9N7_9PEZI|nr:putative HET domain-containing protein [Triangularia verruculosa]
MGFFSSSKSRSSGREQSSWGSFLHKCKKVCKNVAASVAETIATPLVRHATKKIVRRIDEASRAIAPVAYYPVNHVILPAAHAVAIPVVYVSAPVIRKSTAFIDKVNSWAFRNIVKPLYKKALVPILRRLRPPFIEKVIFPAVQKVARALDRALVRPIAHGLVPPVARDIFGLAAMSLLERVSRDSGKASLKTEARESLFPEPEPADDAPQYIEAPSPPPPPAPTPRPTREGPSGQGLVQLVLEKFGVQPETRMSSIFTDFVLSNGDEQEPASFSLLCNRCRNHDFHSGPAASEAIQPNYCTVSDLLRSIKGGCRLCSLVFETLDLPKDGSSPGKRVSVETWVEPGRQDGGLGYLDRIKISTEEGDGFKDKYLSFMAHVPSGDERVAGLLKAYLSPSSDPSLSIDFVRTWQKTCKESHGDHCSNRLVGDPIKNASFKFKTPFRLVDIIDERIEENPEDTCEYVALSYTWGDVSPESKKMQKPTLKDNIRGRTDPQGLAPVLGSDTLPAVYRDTIQLAKRLGYRYIWVDAWCNVQDDDLGLQRQIANMGYIFQNADLTIGAATGRAKDSSLFANPRSLAQPFLIYTTIDGEKHPVIISRQLEEVPSILDTRIWVFQEKLLSRRTVEFGPAYTTWKCTQETATSLPVSQSLPAAEGDPLEIDTSTQKLQVWLRALAGLNSGARVAFSPEFAAAWYSAVRNYTKRSWSIREDQIPALMGLATVIERHMGWRHRAGLWQEDMPYGLSWYRDKEPARVDVLSNMRHDADCAPTWSWASRANGPVSFWPRADVERDLVACWKATWVWPTLKDYQRRIILAGEVVEASICQKVNDDDYDWMQRVDNRNITPVEIQGVRAGYAMLDAPMDLKAVSILPLFTLRPDSKHGAWGVGLALIGFVQGSSCYYKRVGLVVLTKKVGTDYDFTEFDEEDDEHKIILA